MATEKQALTTVASDVVGRLAPSPTGALHLGNARSFLLAWLSARKQQGQVLLRIEDIDSPRVKPWAVDQTIEDLTWLGLDWDPPNSTDDHNTDSSARSYWIQSERIDHYRSIVQGLIDSGRIYPCSCSRSDVERAASAPHDDAGIAVPAPLDGQVYPGTCRGKKLDDLQSGRKIAWRWPFASLPSANAESDVHTFRDQLRGELTVDVAKQLGDFVIAKQDLSPAYQLAVVVDDNEQGVTEVVRGDDLIYSTFRQLAILRHFPWPIPKYFHVPLIIGPDGRRLAKRHGDTRLSYLREQGIAPESIVGYLAATLGLIEIARPLMPHDLLNCFEWDRLKLSPTVFELQVDLPKLKALG